MDTPKYLENYGLQTVLDKSYGASKNILSL